MVEPNRDGDAGVDANDRGLSRLAFSFREITTSKEGFIVALENRCPGKCGDRDQLSGSPDTAGCGESHLAGNTPLQRTVLHLAVSVPPLLRVHVCRWWKTE